MGNMGVGNITSANATKLKSFHFLHQSGSKFILWKVDSLSRDFLSTKERLEEKERVRESQTSVLQNSNSKLDHLFVRNSRPPDGASFQLSEVVF